MSDTTALENALVRAIPETYAIENAWPSGVVGYRGFTQALLAHPAVMAALDALAAERAAVPDATASHQAWLTERVRALEEALRHAVDLVDGHSYQSSDDDDIWHFCPDGRCSGECDDARDLLTECRAALAAPEVTG